MNYLSPFKGDCFYKDLFPHSFQKITLKAKPEERVDADWAMHANSAICATRTRVLPAFLVVLVVLWCFLNWFL